MVVSPAMCQDPPQLASAPHPGPTVPGKAPYRHVRGLSPLLRALRRFLRLWVYAGSKVECPICAHTFRRWLGGGGCPGCGSYPRQRFLWLHLTEEWSGRESPVDVLHVAPEDCLQARFQGDPRVARYVTADQGAPEASTHTDLVRTPFADESFDAIACSHVLEHIPDDRAAMREMLRVLRPGGVAYVQVPMSQESARTDEDLTITDPAERERRYGQFDHVRLYGRDVAQRLREAGFQVREVRVSELVSPDRGMVRFGLWNDVIFRCERPRPPEPIAVAAPVETVGHWRARRVVAG